MDQTSTLRGATALAARYSVAPMMAWTDSLCRQFHRVLTKRTLLYTEMVTAPALVKGHALHLLDHDAAEHPLAVQLGGSDPDMLQSATRLSADAGYQEVNLNVGCPSDRVQSGCFGAVLMTRQELVKDCLVAMGEVSCVDVTVKCRIGVDNQDPYQILPRFLTMVEQTGARRVTIHARKAWLQGLSPKENRDIPPLDYPLVHQMKRDFPNLHLSINGGIADMAHVQDHLAAGMDGVMVGRAAYHTPAQMLLNADSTLFGAPDPCATAVSAARAMAPIIERHLADGGRLHQITRHMLGLFTGQPGARYWRRTLSELGADATSGVQDYLATVSQVAMAQARAADKAAQERTG